MNMLNVILIDDEASSLSSLREKLAQHCPQVHIIAACNEPQQAIQLIDEMKPDLVFLDIEMPVMNGFTLLQQLNNKNFELIFVTAYDHYAIKAIRFSALDYLVKPVEVDELKAAVGKAMDKKHSTVPNERLELLLENLLHPRKSYRRIAIPTAEGLQFIRIEDILYLEASVNYTKFFLLDQQKLIVSRTLKEFEDILPGDTFVRIHNSYLINKNFVLRYIRGDGGRVVMSNGAILDVSKRKKAEFLKVVGF